MTAKGAASIEILGCRVDALDRAAAIAWIVEAARGTVPRRVVTLGVEMVMATRRDARFRAAVASCDLSLCDTIGIMLASRVRGGPLRERVTGVDLIAPLARRSAMSDDLRLYFLGGVPGVAASARDALLAIDPGARIVGARDGYFAPAEDADVIATIAASGANVLLVGLGSPKQEFWLEANLAATGCTVGIGVGGSFDVIAGTKKRAPRAVQRVGLEWLYRLLQEPSRWRRQMALPRFAFAAACEALVRKGSFGR